MDTVANGKKSISLNLKHREGVQILRKLCRKSDVLIEPFRSGVMESLDLGPDVLLKENPALIYARLTGFGQSGYYSKRAGHDINYISVSGLLSLFGRFNEKPAFPLNLAADFGGGGLICALGIVIALYERALTGHGQVVDANMVEGSAYLGSWLFRSRNMPYLCNERGKNVLDGGAHFYEVYETKDKKYVSVGALEPQFYRELLEGLNLSEDEAPQLGDFDNLKKVFTSRFLEKTQAEWCEIFDKLDACVFPVLSVDDAPVHPHNANNSSFVKVSDGFVPNPAPRLSRHPDAVSKAVEECPKRGEHTESVLRKLNYSDGDIKELEKAGVVEIYKKSKL